MGNEPVEVDELVERLRESSARASWAPEPPAPFRRAGFGDPLDGHPAVDYLRTQWTRGVGREPEAEAGITGRARALVRKVAFALPRRALLRERELLTELASLTDALVTRCEQLSAEIEDLHVQLRERAVSSTANEARLAAELDALRRGER